MRRQFDARHESHSCHAQPEEFSPEQQNHNTDQRADKGNSELHRMNLSGHGCRGVCAKRLCISFRCLIQAATPFARRCVWFIGLVGFEPTASWSRTRRSTKLSHSPNFFQPINESRARITSRISSLMASD